MSLKSTLIAAGVIALAFVVIGYFYGESRYDRGYADAVASIVQDSVEVRIDTVKVPYPVPVYYERKYSVVADVDTVNDAIIYHTSTDTTLIVGEDTVAVLTQDISFTEGIFEILTKLEIRPVERLIAITRTAFRTVPVFVPADPPFYNTWITGFISGIISFLLLAIFL